MHIFITFVLHFLLLLACPLSAGRFGKTEISNEEHNSLNLDTPIDLDDIYPGNGCTDQTFSDSPLFELPISYQEKIFRHLSSKDLARLTSCSHQSRHIIHREHVPGFSLHKKLREKCGLGSANTIARYLYSDSVDENGRKMKQTLELYPRHMRDGCLSIVSDICQLQNAHTSLHRVKRNFQLSFIIDPREEKYNVLLELKHCEFKVKIEKLYNDDLRKFIEKLLTGGYDIAYLDISGNHKFRREDLKNLVPALQSPDSRLRYLCLNGNELGDEGVKILMDVLRSENNKIISIEVNTNRISDEGMISIANYLTSPGSHLVKLDVSLNNISNEGFNHLLSKKVLSSEHNKLELISISGHFDDRAIKKFVEDYMESGNRRLLSMRLLNNLGLTHESVKIMSRVFYRDSGVTMRRIYFDGHTLPNDLPDYQRILSSMRRLSL